MTTVLATPLTVKTDAATKTLADRRKAAEQWEPTEEFSLVHWIAAVEASDLPHKLKATARQMAASATSRGYSTIDNQTLADLAEVSRLNTITDRLKRLRASELLESTYRFNTSSQHRLTNPYGPSPHPLDAFVSDFPLSAETGF